MIHRQSLRTAHGIIEHASMRPTDYLYRISLKCLIVNDARDVLVVKESGRTYWDLPGGGMEHGEDTRTAIAREMREEVNMSGDFVYRIIAVDEPKYLEKYGFWQLRLIFAIQQENGAYSAGDDGDEVQFVSPELLKNSEIETEHQIYDYFLMRVCNPGL